MLTRILLIVLVSAMAAVSQTPPIEPGVSQELARWRAARYSDVRYKLNLTLEKMSPVLKGTIEIRVKVEGAKERKGERETKAEAGSVPPIILDWRKIKGFEENSTIRNVSINGRAATLENHPVGEPPTPLLRKEGSFVYQARDEHLIFRDGVVEGENVIKLDFTSPILTSGSAITRYVDKEDGSEYIYSLFVPSDASTAFPVFDQPDLKAKFQLSATVPQEWKFVTNTGIFSQMMTNPSKLLDYQETQPMSTYLFAFAAGPFREVQKTYPNEYFGMGSGGISEKDLQIIRERPGGLIYVRRSQFEKFKPHIQEVFRLNREAIKYFEEYFDYKFPWPKYDLVLIPEFPFGGMEHAGATFVRESAIIFPQEPTKNDHISRALLMFHEASHQWFGDTVTMRWFDDLWLKEGFATFTAYKAMERIMPEMMAWKVFYERVKQAAYRTDSTKGTTPIYQEIKNLSAAKSAYGAIVYSKAPAFLRQAEFYLGEDKFQAAVQAFLKKHEFGNAGWEDLVNELEQSSKQELNDWAREWVTQRGMSSFSVVRLKLESRNHDPQGTQKDTFAFLVKDALDEKGKRRVRSTVLLEYIDGKRDKMTFDSYVTSFVNFRRGREPYLVFPNYEDYGYGIFLLDDKSRDYVLKNIQNEKDPFLRSMMWGALWDSVREAELDPRQYIELVIKNLPTEVDETMISSVLGRATTALNYYVSDKARNELSPQFENALIERLTRAETLGQRITIYRAFLNIASSENARSALKGMLTAETQGAEEVSRKVAKTQSKEVIPLKTKDKFDIVTRLLILNDPEAPKFLAELEKTETSDEAKRYAYAARAGIATAEDKAKYWRDFTENKEISESWIEAAFEPWNSIRHGDLTLPYLDRALAELPNHKRDRKIFFVNGWLGAFIGGQRSEEALAIVNKFLADNPGLDNDLRLKILENVDLIERAVKIRGKYGN